MAAGQGQGQGQADAGPTGDGGGGGGGTPSSASSSSPVVAVKVEEKQDGVVGGNMKVTCNGSSRSAVDEVGVLACRGVFRRVSCSVLCPRGNKCVYAFLSCFPDQRRRSACSGFVRVRCASMRRAPDRSSFGSISLAAEVLPVHPG